MNQPLLSYQGRVDEKGKLTIPRKLDLVKDLALFFPDCDVEVTIRKRYKHRTLPMNAYYWGVVINCVTIGLKDVGYLVTPQQAHEFLKDTFARKTIVNQDTGECISVPGSTAAMTTAEMMDYLAMVREWAEDFLNIRIPLPGEQTKIEFTNGCNT